MNNLEKMEQTIAQLEERVDQLEKLLGVELSKITDYGCDCSECVPEVPQYGYLCKNGKTHDDALEANKCSVGGRCSKRDESL